MDAGVAARPQRAKVVLEIYRYEGVLFDRMAWGRIREHIAYEDTQRTAAFDQRLAELRPDDSS